MGDPMKANGWSKWAVAGSGMMFLAMHALGQAAGAPSVINSTQAAAATRTIVVSLEDRKLALIEDGHVMKVYTVAVGKPSSPSPEGTFEIRRRVKNPVYQHEGKVIQPGPANPVGSRWMGLSIKGYGIHGTNEPKSIGKAASHGCIRMAKKDLEEMYEMVSVGDKVELIGQRNEQTAQLFGGPVPVTVQEPVVLASVAPAPSISDVTADAIAAEK
jgi:lipoprotein-anchoring transpeptidase ErfK/SrfK